MNKFEKIQKRNEILKNVAAFADVAIAYASAPFAAVCGARRDVKKSKNTGKKLRFCDLYRRHFREHITDANSLRLYTRSLEYADMRIARYKPAKYNPQNEITAKGLTNVNLALCEDDNLDVRYFDVTEHQTHSPMRCYFCNRIYMIDFAPAGTKWCGGAQGNGYLFKFEMDTGYRQIATLSPQLSEYLANIADEKFKMQQQQISLSR